MAAGNHLHNWIKKVNVEESFQSCLKKCDIWYQGNTLLIVPNLKQCNVYITKVSVSTLKKKKKQVNTSDFLSKLTFSRLGVKQSHHH